MGSSAKERSVDSVNEKEFRMPWLLKVTFAVGVLVPVCMIVHSSDHQLKDMKRELQHKESARLSAVEEMDMQSMIADQSATEAKQLAGEVKAIAGSKYLVEQQLKRSSKWLDDERQISTGLQQEINKLAAQRRAYQEREGELKDIIELLEGEPVEEFRMTWQFALGAEVGAGADQSRAEELLPYAVDRHPSGQGMIVTHQPVGEIEAVKVAILGLGWQGRKESGHIAENFFARVVVLATNHNVALPGLRQVSHDEGDGGVLVDVSFLSLESGYLTSQGSEGLTGSGKNVGQPMATQFLLLGLVPFRWRFPLEALAQVFGEVLVADSLALSFPRFPREGWILGRISGGLDTEVVPSHLA